jgi:hypothetical protein
MLRMLERLGRQPDVLEVPLSNAACSRTYRTAGIAAIACHRRDPEDGGKPRIGVISIIPSSKNNDADVP